MSSIDGPKAPCDHGIVFDEEAAKGLEVWEIRRRWPRGWFTPEKPCPKCGETSLIAYASMSHYVYGDW